MVVVVVLFPAAIGVVAVALAYQRARSLPVVVAFSMATVPVTVQVVAVPVIALAAALHGEGCPVRIIACIQISRKGRLAGKSISSSCDGGEAGKVGVDDVFACRDGILADGPSAWRRL